MLHFIPFDSIFIYGVFGERTELSCVGLCVCACVCTRKTATQQTEMNKRSIAQFGGMREGIQFYIVAST